MSVQRPYSYIIAGPSVSGVLDQFCQTVFFYVWLSLLQSVYTLKRTQIIVTLVFTFTEACGRSLLTIFSVARFFSSLITKIDWWIYNKILLLCSAKWSFWNHEHAPKCQVLQFVVQFLWHSCIWLGMCLCTRQIIKAFQFFISMVQISAQLASYWNRFYQQIYHLPVQWCGLT